jgi:cell division protein FtsI/penicillin-binding protein 2
LQTHNAAVCQFTCNTALASSIISYGLETAIAAFSALAPVSDYTVAVAVVVDTGDNLV